MAEVMVTIKTEPNYNGPYFALLDALDMLRATKPNDDSEYDRVWYVTIADVEKIFAYFAYMTWTLRNEDVRWEEV